jgi:hypothetical protein
MTSSHPIDWSERIRSQARQRASEHFCRWRQEQVAKIVYYGLPISSGHLAFIFCYFVLLCGKTEAYDARMRAVLVLIAMGLLLVESGGKVRSAHMPEVVASSTTSSAAKARVDFDTQLKPIFQSKCMPCHFSGGQMYDRLPFDKPATIRKLGTRLFTRIKEENDRRLIEDFLTQSP